MRAIRKVYIVAVMGIYRYAEVVGVDAVVGVCRTLVVVLVLVRALMLLRLLLMLLFGCGGGGRDAELRGDIVVIELRAIWLVKQVEVLLLDMLSLYLLFYPEALKFLHHLLYPQGRYLTGRQSLRQCGLFFRYLQDS